MRRHPTGRLFFPAHDRRGGAVQGFTLLEVLVAAAVLAILLTTLYGSLARALSAKDRAEAASAISRTARTALWRIAQDLRGATKVRGESRKVQGRDGDTLVMLSLTPQPLGPAEHGGGQAWIRYFVSESRDPERRPDLVRKISFGSEPGDSRALAMVAGIEGIRFRFFDGKEWRLQWAGEPGKLPLAAELSLDLTDGQGVVRTFSTAVELPLAKGPADRAG